MYGSVVKYTLTFQASKFGLTTSGNVWILPSYYNPNWWKLKEEEIEELPENEKCSNNDMVDIINSVLFIQPVKYPLLEGHHVSIYCEY